MGLVKPQTLPLHDETLRVDCPAAPLRRLFVLVPKVHDLPVGGVARHRETGELVLLAIVEPVELLSENNEAVLDRGAVVLADFGTKEAVEHREFDLGPPVRNVAHDMLDERGGDLDGLALVGDAVEVEEEGLGGAAVPRLQVQDLELYRFLHAERSCPIFFPKKNIRKKMQN